MVIPERRTRHQVARVTASVAQKNSVAVGRISAVFLGNEVVSHRAQVTILGEHGAVVEELVFDEPDEALTFLARRMFDRDDTAPGESCCPDSS